VIYDDRDRDRVRNAVLAVTALAWVLSMGTLSIVPRGLAGAHAHHHPINAGTVSAAAAVNWLLMLAAMMAPVPIQPLQFVRGSSLARPAHALYAALRGYTAVGMLAGAVILSLAAALRSSGLPLYVPISAVSFIALVWQCSPAKQACLNRCHALRELAAFGRPADTDALIFGATHGVWCAGSRWACMLLPLLPGAHIAGMAAVAILIFCERLDDPAPLAWRWRGLGRARRIVVGQIDNLRPIGKRPARRA
jgi:predicted metal-binding membrane protein